MKKIIIMEVDENEKVISKDEYVSKGIGEKSFSSYARCFDEGSPNWSKDPENNLMFLKHTQNYCNELLQSRVECSDTKTGWLFLNEVYDMLGFPKSKAGAVVGWIYKEGNTEGDNCVDFGIYDICKIIESNVLENRIWLDFNVDGLILDKI